MAQPQSSGMETENVNKIEAELMEIIMNGSDNIAKDQVLYGAIPMEDSEKLAQNEIIYGGLMPLEFEDEDEIMVAEDEVEVEVTMDSGCVAHVMPASKIPKGVLIKKPIQPRNFVAANGGSIRNHGTAKVGLQTSAGKQINQTVHVAEVTRALHSTGKCCDAKHEVLYTKDMCTVVPEGTFAHMLKGAKKIAEYPRRDGGRYTAKMKAKRVDAGFTRPGLNR